MVTQEPHKGFVKVITEGYSRFLDVRAAYLVTEYSPLPYIAAHPACPLTLPLHGCVVQ